MEQPTTGKYYAGIGGVVGALFSKGTVIQVQSSYEINWAETFQVCWKAAVGALVGLLVKAAWDKLFKSKKEL